jgi:hypothetical protein
MPCSTRGVHGPIRHDSLEMVQLRLEVVHAADDIRWLTSPGGRSRRREWASGRDALDALPPTSGSADFDSEGSRGKREAAIVGEHDEVALHPVAPDQRGCQMQRVKR